MPTTTHHHYSYPIQPLRVVIKPLIVLIYQCSYLFSLLLSIDTYRLGELSLPIVFTAYITLESMLQL